MGGKAGISFMVAFGPLRTLVTAPDAAMQPAEAIVDRLDSE